MTSSLPLCASLCAAALLVMVPVWAAPSPEPSVADASQAAKPVPTTIVARRHITLPTPEGFVGLTGVNKGWDELQASIVSATNRHLATFGRQADRDAIEKGESPQLGRTMSVQSIRAAESAEVTPSFFSSFSASMRDEVQGIQAKVQALVNEGITAGNADLKKRGLGEAALAVTDTVVLGVFTDTPSGFGFSLGMNVANPDGQPVKRVASCIVAPVNGRILSLYAYSDFAGQDDQLWAERSVSTWRDAIIAANPKVSDAAGDEQSRSYQVGRATAYIVIAIIALLVARFVMRLAGRKRAS